MRVNVGKRDIQNGVQKHCNECPVALATKRALRVPSVDVTWEWIYTRDALGRIIERYRTPEPVREFIHDFDMDKNHWRVKPFRFLLNENFSD